MRKALSTLTILALFAAAPLLAQQAEAPAPNRPGPEVGAPQPAGADQPAPPQIQQEDAARTEVPPVRGAETVPLREQQAGQEGQVAGAETDATVETGARATQEGGAGQAGAGGETEEYAGTEEGGAMPRTASPVPIVLGLGALLIAAGAALRLHAGR